MSVFTLTPMPLIQNEIGRVFDEIWRDDRRWTPNGWTPAVDVTETKDDFQFVVEVPSMSKADIQVTLNQNTLTIKGEKKLADASDASWRRRERRFGAFERSFKLPTMVKSDAIQAIYKDGVLHITLPKADAVKPRDIEIKF